MDSRWFTRVGRGAAVVALGALSPFCAGQAAAGAAPGSAAARRAAVVHAGENGAAGIPRLARALDDEDPLVRRAAVRSLARIGKPAQAQLVAALSNRDALVRRTAVTALIRLPQVHALPYLTKLIHDPNPFVRQRVVFGLALVQSRTPKVTRLLKQAQHDKAEVVREEARNAAWPWQKKVESVRDKPANKDHVLHVVKRIALPTGGWRFHTDPDATGQLSRWFAPDFDDSDWSSIAIGKPWEKQGWKAYDGVAWYRRTFTLPVKPKKDVGVDLAFGGVDESAWVWVNGTFVGAHDLGTSGWDKPFATDVTDVLKWNQPNQITVRVRDTQLAGGIWKPISIEVLAQ